MKILNIGSINIDYVYLKIGSRIEQVSGMRTEKGTPKSEETPLRDSPLPIREKKSLQNPSSLNLEF